MSTLKPGRNFPMPPPGALLAEAIAGLGLSKVEFAARLGVTRRALYDVLDGTTAISPKMALALEREAGSSAEFWLNLQSNYDLWSLRSSPAVQIAQGKLVIKRGGAAAPVALKSKTIRRDASTGAFSRSISDMRPAAKRRGPTTKG